MVQIMNVACWAGVFTVAHLANSAHVGSSSDFLRKAENATSSNSSYATAGIDPFQTTLYGKSKCPCVGIDNLQGYYATNLDYYHVQYPLEAGSSCYPWDLTVHPDCAGGAGPAWCTMRWCYVDPCNCDLDSLPGMSKTGIEYQGASAYWSYETCGFADIYSKAMSPDACVVQMNSSACNSHSKCAWDAEKSRCGGKAAVETCKQASSLDESIYGQDDCRCVGLSGREPGKAYLYVNDEDQVTYPPDVGSTCKAWDGIAHPECQKDDGSDIPDFCASPWCFVDPCKCKTEVPPKMVMEANRFMKFQGKTAFWSPTTCGGDDSWTKSHSAEYCVAQKAEEDCNTLKRCAWTGTECLGRALAGICQKQQESGVLGFEVFEAGAPQQSTLVCAALVLLSTFVAA